MKLSTMIEKGLVPQGVNQGEPEWFALRAGMISASRAGYLMAKTKSGPAASRANLVTQLAIERITGDCVEGYTNYAMQRGIDLEPAAREAYEDHHMALVELVPFVRHPDLPFVSCSPDGLVNDDGMVQFKCPLAEAKHLGALLKGAHAVEYKWQLQVELDCCGREWNDVVSFDPRFPEGLRLAIKRVERDEKMISTFRKEAKAAHDEIEEIVTKLEELRNV